MLGIDLEICEQAAHYSGRSHTHPFQFDIKISVSQLAAGPSSTRNNRKAKLTPTIEILYIHIANVNIFFPILNDKKLWNPYFTD